MTMISENKRQIGILLLANIVVIHANGQNYNQRGNLHTGIAVDDDEYLLNTEYYSWNEFSGASEIWRWNVEEYPHPQLDFRLCNRLSPSNICDPDRILTLEQVDKMDSIITKLFNETKCICKNCDFDNGGLKIGIALLKNTFQPYIEHPSKIIRSFTENLRSKWNLGECQNDILIVVATDDRQSYTDVGNAAAQYISKENAYSVFNESRKYFSVGDYYNGLLQMLQNYEKLAEGFAKNKDDAEIGIALLSGIIVVIVILIAIIAIIAILLHKRRNRSQKPVKTIQKMDSPKEAKLPISRPSWRQKSIRTLFSTFKSTNDTYQACKSQDEKLSKLPPYSDDEEVLNLELALPDPVPHGEVKNDQAHNPSSHTIPQDCQIEVDDQSTTKDTETDYLNNDGLHMHRNGVTTRNGLNLSPLQEESLSSPEINSKTFETFTPKSQNKQFHQTDL